VSKLYGSFKLIDPSDIWGDYISWCDPVKFSTQSDIVGYSSCKFMSPAPYVHSSFWKHALKLDSNLCSFDWPKRDFQAEKTSFELQCDRHTVGVIPSTEDLLRSREILLPQYINHQLPKFWHESDIINALRGAIKEYKPFLKNDSTPGVPYAFTASRNDKLLEALGDRFDECIIARIVNRLGVTLESLKTMSRADLIKMNLVDPVRVFVKGEPHKVKKILEGRVRLIMSVSVVDKMIEMLLMRHLSKLEIQNWDRIPSKPGIGFSERDVNSVYFDVMSNKPMSSTDVEAWDWSCQEWQLVEEAECAILLCDNPTKVWEHLMRVTALIESRSVYQFSDGTLVAPSFTGLVNSGKFKTSRGNSFMRAQLATLIGCDRCSSAGDDTIERTVTDAIAKYAFYGFKIKVYDSVEDSFEFCSRLYTPNGSWPVNYEKILMNLLHNIPKTALEFRMYMTGFVDDLEHHPEFLRIMNLIETVGYLELAGTQDIVDDATNSNHPSCGWDG
jgi:hypothetical protein